MSRITLLLLFSTVVVCRLLLEDFESQAALQNGHLLNDQHIVMIGDSSLRHQYVSLVNLDQTESAIEPGAVPNVIVESSNFPNKVLFSDEYCDGYDNRYYHNAARNISLSFYLFKGDRWPMKGQYPLEEWEYEHVYDVITHVASMLITGPPP